MQQLHLRGTAPALPPISLRNIIGLGAAFGPFDALLTLHLPPPTGNGFDYSRLILLLSSILAGAVTSFLCSFSIKMDQSPLPRKKAYLLSLLGALGVILATIAVKVTWRLAHVAITNPEDLPLFVALLAFFNCFVLLYIQNARSRARLIKTQTELRSLEICIQPHFFFNTLNTISAFIPDQPQTAQELIGRLSALYRRNLPEAGQGMVPLQQEIALTMEYLEIEKARFGARLNYTLPTAPATPRIPALTLQHLVENAVRHGIAKLPEGGTIRVELNIAPNSYELTISNPVEDSRDIDLNHLVREGHSLQLLADRLRLLYRGQASFLLELDQEFRVRLRIPTGH